VRLLFWAAVAISGVLTLVVLAVVVSRRAFARAEWCMRCGQSTDEAGSLTTWTTAADARTYELCPACIRYVARTVGLESDVYHI
jgi:hypothetical protein